MNEDGHKYFFAFSKEMPWKRKENTMNYWYNFRAGKYEPLNEPPKSFEDYIPKEGLNLYNLYIQHLGIEPIEAAKKVLLIIVVERNG